MHQYLFLYIYTLQQQSAVAALTFLQLLVPHFDDEGRVFAVVDDPQRQSLDALLRAAQLRQLLLQGRLREGRHDAGRVFVFVCACFTLWPDGTPTRSKATELRAGLEKLALSSKLELCCKLPDMQRRSASCCPLLFPGVSSLPGWSFDQICWTNLQSVRWFTCSCFSTVCSVCLQPRLMLARRAKQPSADQCNSRATPAPQPEFKNTELL